MRLAISLATLALIGCDEDRAARPSADAGQPDTSSVVCVGYSECLAEYRDGPHWSACITEIPGGFCTIPCLEPICDFRYNRCITIAHRESPEDAATKLEESCSPLCDPAVIRSRGLGQLQPDRFCQTLNPHFVCGYTDAGVSGERVCVPR